MLSERWSDFRDSLFETEYSWRDTLKQTHLIGVSKAESGGVTVASEHPSKHKTFV